MGLVYLLTPAVCNGFNRHKVGCSKQSDFRRLNNYGANSTVHCMFPNISNPEEVEAEVIAAFRKQFPVGCGKEYFDGDINEMIPLFTETVQRCLPIKKRTTETKKELRVGKKTSPRVAFETKMVNEFLDDRVLITNNPDDRMTIDEMYIRLKMWWLQFTRKKFVDLYDFNEYVREALPEHCDGKRQFVGIKFGKKINDDSDPEVSRIIQFIDYKLKMTNRRHLYGYDLRITDIYVKYKIWWQDNYSGSVPDETSFYNFLTKTIPDELLMEGLLMCFIYRTPDPVVDAANEKEVAKFLDECFTITDCGLDWMNADTMYKYFKFWCPSCSIQDHEDFGHYARKTSPKKYKGRSVFHGIRKNWKMKKDEDDPEVIRMIQFMEDNFEYRSVIAMNRLTLEKMYYVYQVWWRNMYTERVPDSDVFIDILKRTVPADMINNTHMLGLRYVRQDEI
jgi:hypothetical protein